MRGTAFAYAEQQYRYQPEVHACEGGALAVADLPMEQWVQGQFRMRFLGAVGLRRSAEILEPEQEGPTLACAIDRAVEGDEQCNDLVDINVSTAVSEACFKDGHVTRVTKDIDANGGIVQFGLDLHQMHYNSYTLRAERHQSLRQHTLAEALNGYREQAYLRAGLLEKNILIVASCVAEDLPEELLDYRGEGFFTRTMSYCLQATTQEGDKVITESAFRRGTAASEDASYEARVERRYDNAAIGMVYEWLGIKAPKSALELLQQPVLIHKSKLPNGVVDFLRLCDIATDMLHDVQVKRTEDQYRQMIIDSATREAGLADVKAAVKQELLSHAGTFEHPADANKLLWELIKKHLVFEAGKNMDIDPMVFGPRAASRIAKAREAAASGDWARMERWLVSAERVAQVSGCGGGASEREARGELVDKPQETKNEEKVATDKPVNCPFCNAKVVLDKKLVDAGILHCTACKITKDICNEALYYVNDDEKKTAGQAMVEELIEWLNEDPSLDAQLARS
ncbi:MAG TPA: hypothetical protein VJ836_07400 [Candidatus Saccharimonadales bacterium]|nr:hypothetical protein [Candidatus Saccharimonadales bacterium]